jgi:hypothetical protein
MGLDIWIFREETLSEDWEKGEKIIKRNNMYEAKGWELGEFLQHSFDIQNCVPQLIEPEEALEKVEQELEDLDYQPSVEATNQGWHDGYVDDLKSMVAVLTEAVGDASKVHYHWELSW